MREKSVLVTFHGEWDGDGRSYALKSKVGPVQSDDLPFFWEEEKAEAVIRAGEKYVFLLV